MANDSLRLRLDRMIEELMRAPTGKEDAAVASLLMAAQTALGAGELDELALAAWAFVDARRFPRIVSYAAD